MKAVAYLRVSTPKQADEDGSFETQRLQIEEECEKKKWKLVHVYKDVYSGAKADRPDYRKLMEAAAKKQFDVVVCADLTRFGRSAVELHKSVELLRTYGISFYSIKGNVDTSDTNPFQNLMFHILTAMAEFEREMIRVRMGETKIAKWKKNKIFVGNLPYGNTWNEETCKIEQVDNEVKVYKRIFSEYMYGEKSLSDICIGLNKDKIPGRHGGRWVSATISSILKSPCHYGVFVANKYVMNDKGKILGERPENEHILYETKPIISKKEWDALQARLASAAHRAGRPSRESKIFLLHQLIKCGICGGSLVPHYNRYPPKDWHRHRYYVCYRHNTGPKFLEERGRKRCSMPNHPATPLENFVFDILRARLGRSPEKTAEMVHVEQWDEKIQVRQQKIFDCKADILKKQRGLNRLNRVIFDLKDEDFDIISYERQVIELTHELRDTKQELKKFEEDLESLIQLRDDQHALSELVSNADQRIRIHQELAKLSFEQKRKLLKGLLTGPITVHDPAAVSLPENFVEQYGEEARVVATYASTVEVPPFRYNEPVLQEILGSWEWLAMSRLRRQMSPVDR